MFVTARPCLLHLDLSRIMNHGTFLFFFGNRQTNNVAHAKGDVVAAQRKAAELRNNGVLFQAYVLLGIRS